MPLSHSPSFPWTSTKEDLHNILGPWGLSRDLLSVWTAHSSLIGTIVLLWAKLPCHFAVCVSLFISYIRTKTLETPSANPTTGNINYISEHTPHADCGISIQSLNSGSAADLRDSSVSCRVWDSKENKGLCFTMDHCFLSFNIYVLSLQNGTICLRSKSLGEKEGNKRKTCVCLKFSAMLLHQYNFRVPWRPVMWGKYGNVLKVFTFLEC